MYGLIGKIVTAPGKRAELATILTGMDAMEGCSSYIVAADGAEPDALWVTEVWESREAHAASLELPAVRAAIAEGRHLIVGFESQIETEPLGGIGLG
jgi:quinol monooxygenase YgiN